MTNRGRGDYFEHQTRDALDACGWVVLRAAGSLGPADLVALRRGNTPLLVACKVGALRIDPAERLAIITAAEQAGARPLLAHRGVPGQVDLWTVQVGPQRQRVDRLPVPSRKRS